MQKPSPLLPLMAIRLCHRHFEMFSLPALNFLPQHGERHRRTGGQTLDR